MSGTLSVQTDGLRGYAQTHTDVAGALSGLAAPQPAGVQTSHGAIASAVTAALADALGVRQATILTTSRSGSTLADLLLRAAQAYERGDQRAGDALQAAADAMDPAAGTAGAAVPPSPSGSGTAPVPGATPAAGGGDVAGQLAGQIGQQAAQLGQMAAQAIMAPLQALAAPLQQLPQQLTGGLQPGVGVDVIPESEDTELPVEDRHHPDDDTDSDEARPGERGDKPGRGEGSAPGRAPDPPAQPAVPDTASPKPAPAQTRPQSG